MNFLLDVKRTLKHIQCSSNPEMFHRRLRTTFFSYSNKQMSSLRIRTQRWFFFFTGSFFFLTQVMTPFSVYSMYILLHMQYLVLLIACNCKDYWSLFFCFLSRMRLKDSNTKQVIHRELLKNGCSYVNVVVTFNQVWIHRKILTGQQLHSRIQTLKRLQLSSLDNDNQHQSISSSPHNLQGKQLEVYTAVDGHYQSNSPPPLHMIVSGTAGTGKSYLIHCLRLLLKDLRSMSMGTPFTHSLPFQQEVTSKSLKETVYINSSSHCQECSTSSSTRCLWLGGKCLGRSTDVFVKCFPTMLRKCLAVVPVCCLEILVSYLL